MDPIFCVPCLWSRDCYSHSSVKETETTVNNFAHLCPPREGVSNVLTERCFSSASSCFSSSPLENLDRRWKCLKDASCISEVYFSTIWNPVPGVIVAGSKFVQPLQIMCSREQCPRHAQKTQSCSNSALPPPHLAFFPPLLLGSSLSLGGPDTDVPLQAEHSTILSTLSNYESLP